MEKEKFGRVDGQRDGGLRKRFKGTGGNNECSKRNRHNGKAQVLEEPV